MAMTWQTTPRSASKAKKIHFPGFLGLQASTMNDCNGPDGRWGLCRVNVAMAPETAQYGFELSSDAVKHQTTVAWMADVNCSDA